MFCVTFLAVLALVNGAAVHQRALQPMDPASLASFSRMFRNTLLDKVAAEWNTTVGMTKTLKAKMTACNTTINNQISSCKTCTQSTCQENPSFLDYLSLANPYTYLQGPLNDLASKFSDVASLMGDQANSFFSSISGLAGSATDSVTSGFLDAYHSVTSGLSAIGNSFTDLGHGVVDVGNQVGNTLTDAGHTLEHAGQSIGHAIGSIFGKRDLDPKVRECMQKCNPCHPLLLPQDKMISQLCGADIVNMNNTINSRVKKIQGIYDTALDTAHPVLSKLEFDFASMNANMQLTNVYVTVRMHGKDVRYKTGVPYSMMQLPQTANLIALEYWNKF